MDDFDALLERAKEESLRIYNEVEVPRNSLEPERSCSSDADVGKNEDGFSQDSPLYKGKEAEGFHITAGKTYVYPSNYTVRKYQSDIVPTALFHNTLVCLPTGLGKTFIAAVIMYNFYRWYPMSKVIFMAPTKPLVAQQMTACRDIMGIPSEDTVEMTGLTNPQERQLQWKNKRVLYLTPHVLINDLRNNILDPSFIKCIVIDEAHRATKDYAYCQVVRFLFEANLMFRLVALSATPGSDIKAIKEVIHNLRIEKMEVRSEDCTDVTPYTHSKTIDRVVVELSPFLKSIWCRYLQIYDTYYRRIRDTKVLSTNITNMTKFQVLVACRKFSTNPPSTLPKHVVQLIVSDFNVCVSLAHARELLENYGLRVFYNSFTEAEKSTDKSLGMSRLCHDPDLRRLLSEIQKSISQDENNPQEYIWSHPKFEHLVDVMKKHFSSFEESKEKTKAIVFCQFRLVVSEVYEVLVKFVPEVKPVMFIGQGGKEKGLPQKKQLEVMKQFRAGEYNVLIATCVAEEGLDIGDVDLLVLMEGHKSPVRLVQRLGRTGRHRNGRCVVLLTKGVEEKKFSDGMSTHRNYMNIVNSPQVTASLQKTSPRMIPFGCKPTRQLVHIKVLNSKTPDKKRKKQSDIRQIFNNRPLMSKDPSKKISSPFLSEAEMEEVKAELGTYVPRFDRLPPAKELWHRRYGTKMSVDEIIGSTWSSLSVWNDWNMEPQKTFVLGHSKDTDILIQLLNKAKILKTGEKSDGLAAESGSLWSTVGSSRKTTQFETKCENPFSSTRKHSTDTVPKASKILNLFEFQKNRGCTYIEDDDIITDIYPTKEIETDIILLNDRISNLLDSALKDYDNIYHEFEGKCALEKSNEISNCLKRYMILSNHDVNTSLFNLNLNLLNDEIFDGIKSINVKDILKNNSKSEINDTNEKIFCDNSKVEPFSPVDVFNEFTEIDFEEQQYKQRLTNQKESIDKFLGSESDEEFIGIDDLLGKPKEIIPDKNSTSISVGQPLIFSPSFSSVPQVPRKEDLFKIDVNKNLENESSCQNNKQLSPVFKSNFSSPLKPMFKKNFLENHDEKPKNGLNGDQKSPAFRIKFSTDPVLKPFFYKDLTKRSFDNNNKAGFSNCKQFSPFDNKKITNSDNMAELQKIGNSFGKLIENRAEGNLMEIPSPDDDCFNKKSNPEYENKTELKKDLHVIQSEYDQLSPEIDFVGIDDLFRTKDDNSFNKIIDHVTVPGSNTTGKNFPAKEFNFKNENIVDSRIKIIPPGMEVDRTRNVIKENLDDDKSDESSRDSQYYIPGTPENKVSSDIWSQTPEALRQVVTKLENDLSPILSGKPVIKTPNNGFKCHSNTHRSVSPILSGRFVQSFSQIKCSTPITADKQSFKTPHTVDSKNVLITNNIQCLNNMLIKSTENVSNSKKKLFRNENDASSNDSSDCTEVWEIDDVFKDTIKSSSDVNTQYDRLSFYQKGDSLYTVTQLVEKAEEMEKNNWQCNADKNNKPCNVPDKKIQLAGKPEVKQKSNDCNFSKVLPEISDMSADFNNDISSPNSSLKVNNSVKNKNCVGISETLDSKQLPLEDEKNNVPSTPERLKNKKYISKILSWDSSEDDFFANLSPDKDYNKTPTQDTGQNISLPIKENKNIPNKDDLFDDIIDLTLLEDDLENYDSNVQKNDLNLKKRLDHSLNNSSIKFLSNNHKKPKINHTAQNKPTKIDLFSKKINTILTQPSSKLETNCHSVLNDSSCKSKSKVNEVGNLQVVRQCTVPLPNSTSKSINKSTSLISPDRSGKLNCNSSVRSSASKSSDKSITVESPDQNKSGSSSRVHSASKNKNFSDFFDSDDSDVFVQQKKKTTKIGNTVRHRPKAKEKPTAKEKRRNIFIDSEAEVSGGTSSGAETSGLDSLDESFIDDFTQKQENSMVFNKYRETIKDTNFAAGKFKIPQLSKSVMARDVFSQSVAMEQESYENDSFCVGTSDSNGEGDDMSYLEIAEKMLEREIKRRFKKAKKTKKRSENKKRKRSPSLSGSETDFEGTPHSKSIINDEESMIIIKKKRRKVVLLTSSSESD